MIFCAGFHLEARVGVHVFFLCRSSIGKLYIEMLHPKPDF